MQRFFDGLDLLPCQFRRALSQLGEAVQRRPRRAADVFRRVLCRLVLLLQRLNRFLRGQFGVAFGNGVLEFAFACRPFFRLCRCFFVFFQLAVHKRQEILDRIAHRAPRAQPLLFNAQHGEAAFFGGVTNGGERLFGLAHIKRDTARGGGFEVTILFVGVLDRLLHLADARRGLVHLAAHQGKGGGACGDDGGNRVGAHQRGHGADRTA